MKITEHIYQIGGMLGTGVLGANAFLIIKDDTLTLIDTGFMGSSKQILKEVYRLGYSPSDISSIIITHYHYDHIGSLASLKKATGASVIAHTAEAPYIDGRLPQPEPSRPQLLDRLMLPLIRMWPGNPVEVGVTVEDGDVLPVPGGIEVWHTPGHTSGSICLFIPGERTLIAGDLIGNRFRLSLPSKTWTVNMAQNIESIKKVLSLDFDIICFGHGFPILEKANEAIRNFAKKLESSHR